MSEVLFEWIGEGLGDESPPNEMYSPGQIAEEGPSASPGQPSILLSVWSTSIRAENPGTPGPLRLMICWTSWGCTTLHVSS